MDFQTIMELAMASIFIPVVQPMVLVGHAYEKSPLSEVERSEIGSREKHRRAKSSDPWLVVADQDHGRSLDPSITSHPDQILPDQ